MSIASTSTGREPHDLSHLIFGAGKIGRLQTLSTVPVIAGDSYQENIVGSLRLSPLRRGLAVDSVVDVFSFFIPHRHIYGDEWVEFMKAGMKSTPLTPSGLVTAKDNASRFGISGGANIGEQANAISLPSFLTDGYDSIYNNYFKAPYDDDYSNIPDIGSDIEDDHKYGYRCAHLKSLWTAPLPPNDNEFADFGVTDGGGDGDTIDLMDMNRQMAMLHTEQERDFFMQRYRDVMSQGFGGSTSIDADERPQLLKRTTFWASGYDVNGTDQESLGQYSGRVQQSFKHSIPRKYIPEHGVVWTMAVVRFPVTHHQENHYLFSENHKSLTYEDLAGDPVITANSKPAEVSTYDIFGDYGSAEHTFEVPHSQWYRHHPDVVHSDYAAVQGFPFLKEIPNSFESSVYTNDNDYTPMFQTEQLGHWQVQARKNVNIIRRLPTARSSIITND